MLMSQVLQVCRDLQVHQVQNVGMLALANLKLLHQEHIWIPVLTLVKYGHEESNQSGLPDAFQTSTKK
jgi:hypothetical protein